jgi:urease accessory protein
MQVVSPDPGWTIGKHALMNLHAVRRNGRTEIDPRSWRIPYQWQGTHYQDHDDQPFLLLINSGGGFVEGDVAELHATLEPGTRALITTTAASKFYKCPEGRTSREEVDIRVVGDSLLEYLPDEAIPFAQSRVGRRTRIALDAGSRLFATDMISAGRIAFGPGETFRFASIDSTFEVVVAGETVALDRLLAVDEFEVQSLQRLWAGAYHAVTVLAYGLSIPADVEEQIEASLAGMPLVAGGASRIDDLVVCRLLASEAWHAHEAIHACWSVLRPPLAGKAARPIRKC